MIAATLANGITAYIVLHVCRRQHRIQRMNKLARLLVKYHQMERAPLPWVYSAGVRP